MKRKRPLSIQRADQVDDKSPLVDAADERRRKVIEFPIVDGQFDDASSPEKGQFEDAPEDQSSQIIMKAPKRIQGTPMIDRGGDGDGKEVEQDGDEVRPNLVSFEDSPPIKDTDPREPGPGSKVSRTANVGSHSYTSASHSASTTNPRISSPYNQNTMYSASPSAEMHHQQHLNFLQQQHLQQQLQQPPPNWSQYANYASNSAYASASASASANTGASSREIPLSNYWEAYINRQANEMREHDEWARVNTSANTNMGAAMSNAVMESHSHSHGHNQMPTLSETRRMQMEYESNSAAASAMANKMPPLNQAMHHSSGMPMSNIHHENEISSAMMNTQHHQQQQQQQNHPPNQQPVFPSEITLNDVLLGRGGGTNRHNAHFRQMVSEAQPQYVQARKKDKTRIAKSIVATIRSRNGRFLKIFADGYYLDVGDKQATMKTSQALREGLSGRMREIVKVGGTGGAGVGELKKTGTDTEGTVSDQEEDIKAGPGGVKSSKKKRSK